VSKSNELRNDVREIVVNGMSQTKWVVAACNERLADTKCTLVIIKLQLIEFLPIQITTYESASSVSIDELQILVLAMLIGNRLLDNDPTMMSTQAIT
jgi:hypothetical protein